MLLTWNISWVHSDNPNSNSRIQGFYLFFSILHLYIIFPVLRTILKDINYERTKISLNYSHCVLFQQRSLKELEDYVVIQKRMSLQRLIRHPQRNRRKTMEVQWQGSPRKKLQAELWVKCQMLFTDQIR